MFKTVIKGVAFASAMALAHGAMADGMPRRSIKDFAPAPFSWTGFYIGVNAGVAWDSDHGTRFSSTSQFPGGALNPDVPPGLAALAAGNHSAGNDNRFIGGGQLGYNWQTGSLVIGVEADYQAMGKGGASATSITSAIVVGVPVTSTNTTTRSIDTLGTVRARLGVLLTPQLLGYITGGFAFGKVDGSTTIAQVGDNGFTGGGSFGFSDTLTGWTVGGGAEWMFARNWTFKAEYLYYDLGDVSYSGPLQSAFFPANFGSPSPIYGSTVSSTSYSGHLARVGINYKF